MDHNKTLTRTRTRRGSARIDAVDGLDLGRDVDGKPLEEIELFDDTDFYQQLLRDIIDGQPANGKTTDSDECTLIFSRIWRR